MMLAPTCPIAHVPRTSDAVVPARSSSSISVVAGPSTIAAIVVREFADITPRGLVWYTYP